jgi:N-acetylneuraminic acid mutarotase/signal peptidase I
MKAILRYILFISLLSILIKCDKDEITSRNYPRLKTLLVTEITSEGAKFSAEIIYRGDFEVINYGFVWSESENPTLENSDRVVYSENIQTNHFFKTIETTLKKEVSYFVKAFIKTDDYIVYGESMDFFSLGSKAPEIKTIYPGHGTIGDTITIKGSSFSYLNSTNKVYFDGIESTIISSSDTLVKVIVPVVGKDSVSVSLSILGNISEYDGVFDLTTPIIEDFIPKQGAIDDTITIAGKYFSYLPESNIIKIGGIQCSIVSSSKNQIKAIIPPSLDIQNAVSLTIGGQVNISNKQFKFLPPIINSFDNTEVSFGEEVTMSGHNFSFISENNLIFLNGVQAEVLNATKENILFKIPNNLSNAENTLTLKVAGRELNYEFINIKVPVIQSIEASVISHYNNGNLTVSGKNFNPLAGKNSILLGDQQATIVSSSNNQIVIEFPRSIIPKVELSVLDTLDVTVTVLDQSSVLEKSLIIDYKSTWTKMHDFPGNPRIFGAYFSINDKGYIGLGGGDEFDNWYKDFWEYDPVIDMWTRLEDFPGTARSKFATFVIGNDAYIICGTIGNQYTESNNLSEVWKFNGVSHTWAQMNDFPGGARWSPFGFSIGNIGFFGGGVYGNYTSKKDFWQYNPNTDLWSQLDNIPDNIWEEDLFAISDSEFGYLLTDYCGSPCNKRYFWKYTPSTQEWQSIESMPGPYRETTGFNINNRFYVGTGVFSSWTGTSAFYSYNPNLNEWTNMPFFVESRRTASSFSINDFGYLLLGKSGSHSANKNDVWKFDPSKTD